MNKNMAYVLVKKGDIHLFHTTIRMKKEGEFPFSGLDVEAIRQRVNQNSPFAQQVWKP